MGIKESALPLIVLQGVLLILFFIFGEYKTEYGDGSSKYPIFQDVHVMIFIGFGFLMTFLKRYGYSSVGFTLLLGSIIIQWALLCQGFFELNADYKIELGIESIYKADIATASVLISMGAVLGRTSVIQLVVMGSIEIVLYCSNLYLGSKILKVADAGGSIFVHAFGAYFGLAASYVLNRKKKGKSETASSLQESSYTSDLFAMIGTIFLWLYWPSFNAIELKGDDQQRAVINTYLALASCCVTAFAASLLFSPDRKFDMVHVQNSTLAGGVAVGASANLMLHPGGAIAVGIAAGFLSVCGYSRLTPILENTFSIPDTCGVHNLHGLPAVFAGLVSGIMAGIASEDVYHKSLYEIYPARSDKDIADIIGTNVFPEDGRNAGQQAGYQILGLVVTLAIAVVGGLVTGFVLIGMKIGDVPSKSHYNDAAYWNLPDELTQNIESLHNPYDNPSFEIPKNEGVIEE
ncbi:rhesus blood group-associated glycoprotein Rh50 [Leptinotarsa decemlineata]|uniref:rhesus blood group-associated glycoprotein Rh50 n=1 Tax=Leptinotarsa decemlineata TaxID=7539 RepID=UPI003D309C7D